MNAQYNMTCFWLFIKIFVLKRSVRHGVTSLWCLKKFATMFMQLEHLKTLLLSGSSEKLSNNVAGGCVDPDLATALVHGVEEERDELRLRQAELSHALKQLEAENAELQTTIGMLREALHAAEGQSQSADDELKVCICVFTSLL